MTRLAARHLLLPTAQLRQLSMGSVREEFELIFVTVFAGVAADIIFRLERDRFGLPRLRRLRGAVGTQPTKRRHDEGTDQECFDEPVQA